MKSRHLSLVLLALAACTPSMTPQQKAFLQELADRPMTCRKAADCDEKWSRAIEWVSRHSETGLKTVSDNLIATNLESSGGRDALKYPEYTVVRYTDGGLTRMEFTSFCEHGFDCGSRALKLRAGFVTKVMGPPPGVTEVRPGEFQKKIAP